MSKLSIVTINYNNLHGLQRTMESVINQTWQEFEYIVIDGGSNDGSAAYIAGQSEHIDYWVSEPDKGIYNAMNKGISKANGDYILFLNSGDELYLNNSLQSIIPYISNHSNIDIIYGSLSVVGQKEWIKEYPSILSLKYFIADSLPHPSTLIKRECFNSLLYDESLKIVSDWKFFILGFSKYNFTYLKIDVTISKFYQDGISSTNFDLVSNEKNSVFKNDLSFFLTDYKEIYNNNNVVNELREKYFLAKNSYSHIFKNLFNRIFGL